MPQLTPSSDSLENAPTTHRLILADARDMGFIPDQSVHLVVTSPPYWNLKRYNENPSQLGHLEDYEPFLGELTKVWKHAYRVLVPGGRLVCVVGDVCLSRRAFGRHVVFPLHSDISVICRKLGFDNLNPIIWHKIANANYEVNNGTKFLGKPYEPNAIIKNDIEFILMQCKPGGYRKPTLDQRRLSMISKEDYDAWFRQFWTITGASTRQHPAPFPLELASRLVRMFSFYGDTVLDPFSGTGTTMLAALKAGRNSIGLDIDPEYCRMAAHRLTAETSTLFSKAKLIFQSEVLPQDGRRAVRESSPSYETLAAQTARARKPTRPSPPPQRKKAAKAQGVDKRIKRSTPPR
jgi:site-specific DNA-methyltransferase (adenine-specific)